MLVPLTTQDFLYRGSLLLEVLYAVTMSGRIVVPVNFQLLALDQAPGLPASFTLDDVIAATAGHAIGRARLDGTYEIR